MQNTLSQQGKSGPAKHHALNELNPGDLAFHLPI